MDQHGCTAGAALKGTCYLTKYELSRLKGIIKTNHFALKKVPKSKASQPDVKVKVTQFCDAAAEIIWMYIYIYTKYDGYSCCSL